MIVRAITAVKLRINNRRLNIIFFMANPILLVKKNPATGNHGGEKQNAVRSTLGELTEESPAEPGREDHGTDPRSGGYCCGDQGGNIRSQGGKVDQTGKGCMGIASGTEYGSSSNDGKNGTTFVRNNNFFHDFFLGSWPGFLGFIALSKKTPKVQPCTIGEVHHEPNGQTDRKARGELRKHKRSKHFHPFQVAGTISEQINPAMNEEISTTACALSLIC